MNPASSNRFENVGGGSSHLDSASDSTLQAPVDQKVALMVLTDLDASAMLIDHLATQRWEIEYVPDNESALSLVHERSFDLIITAETTSAKADIALLRKIRRIRPHSRMIILTSDSTPADVVSALREHAFSFFSTPYSLDALAQVIRIAMEGPCWDDGIEVLSATPAWVRLVARCDLSTAERVMQFFHEMIDLPEDEKNEVALAFREMLLNAIRHGGQFDSSQYVEISYVRARHMVECRVKDPGRDFRSVSFTTPQYRILMTIQPGTFTIVKLQVCRLADTASC